MKKLTTLLLISFLLAGCVLSPFKIKEADMRFSAGTEKLYISENNRISSKSIVGGIHLDSMGVYLNPFASKSKINSSGFDSLGLSIINKTDYDTNYGDVNQFGMIRQVIFLFPDGELMTLNVTSQDSDTSGGIYYNSVSRSASYDKYEYGSVNMTKAQFEKIATSRSISCKIIGSKTSATYEESDIDKKFLVNILDFYNKHVK